MPAGASYVWILGKARAPLGQIGGTHLAADREMPGKSGAGISKP